MSTTIPIELITHQNIDALCAIVIGNRGARFAPESARQIPAMTPDVAVLHDFLLDAYPDTTDLIDPSEIVVADEGSQLSKWLTWAAPDAKINQGFTTQESFWNRHGGAIIYRIRNTQQTHSQPSQPTVTLAGIPASMVFVTGSVPYKVLQRSTHGDTLRLRNRCSMIARLCDSGLLPEIL